MLVLAHSGIASAITITDGNFVVPEIDPVTAGSGLALLTGAVLLLVERYRSR